MRIKVLAVASLLTAVAAASLLSSCTPETLSPAELTSAAQIFTNDCASCHGADRTGDRGPDITGSELTDFTNTSLIAFLAGHKTAKKLTPAQVSILADWLQSP